MNLNHFHILIRNLSQHHRLELQLYKMHDDTHRILTFFFFLFENTFSNISVYCTFCCLSVSVIVFGFIIRNESSYFFKLQLFMTKNIYLCACMSLRYFVLFILPNVIFRNHWNNSLNKF